MYFLREITTLALIGDVLKGHVDVAYVTYLGYDEIAHHSGTRDDDAFNALRNLDKQFHRVEMASNLPIESINWLYILITVKLMEQHSNSATIKHWKNWLRNYCLLKL